MAQSDMDMTESVKMHALKGPSMMIIGLSPSLLLGIEVRLFSCRPLDLSFPSRRAAEAPE